MPVRGVAEVVIAVTLAVFTPPVLSALASSPQYSPPCGWALKRLWVTMTIKIVFAEAL